MIKGRRGVSSCGAVDDLIKPSACITREYAVSAKISHEAYDSALYRSSGSAQDTFDNSAYRANGSKRGSSPFAVSARPSSASQPLGLPFIISSEPLFPHAAMQRYCICMRTAQRCASALVAG